MKDTQKKENNQRKELLPEKLGVQKSIVNKNAEVAFAAALSQGTIPHTYGPELFAGLSKLGNYSFLKVLENNERTNKKLIRYTDDETFSQEKVGLLKERLSGDFDQDVNEVELMPEMDKCQPIPGLIGEESGNLSTLTPVPFDQAIIE
ncbi:MAG: hypothetical protein APF81_03620 [Desulfosporosinus sp. BRH_c37]|nr:MAG: hypothetical protein APF81_03620 [Desulfosporosinus sp. BRH_c37]